MAAFLFLVPLLFTGTPMISAYSEKGNICSLLLNATQAHFNVTVNPKAYQTNTSYTVRINDNIKNATKYLLQALSPQNVSTGEWKMENKENCDSIETAILNAAQKEAQWVSLDSNTSSVEIRAYIIIHDQSAQLNTLTLNKESTTSTPPATSPNSVAAVQSSCLFLAALQLLLLLLTSKLFS